MLPPAVRDDHPACSKLKELSDCRHVPLHPAGHLLRPALELRHGDPFDQAIFIILVFKESRGFDQVDHSIGTHGLLKNSHDVVVFRVDSAILLVNNWNREHWNIAVIEKELEETLVDSFGFA